MEDVTGDLDGSLPRLGEGRIFPTFWSMISAPNKLEKCTVGWAAAGLEGFAVDAAAAVIAEA